MIQHAEHDTTFRDHLIRHGSVIAGLVLGALIALGLAYAAGLLDAEQPEPRLVPVQAETVQAEPVAGLGMPACETDDDTDCYWDASRQGDGSGTSFINYEGTTYHFDYIIY